MRFPPSNIGVRKLYSSTSSAVEVRAIAQKVLDRLNSDAFPLKNNHWFHGSALFRSRDDSTYDHVYENKRELDSFARCLAVQDPCTAVIKHSEILEISFNNEKGIDHKKLSKISNPVMVKEVDDYIGKFKDLYNAHKLDELIVHVFKDSRGYAILKGRPTPLDNISEAHPLFPLVQEFQSFNHSLKQDQDYGSISKAYYKLLNSVHTNHNLSQIPKKAILSALLMPMQDIQKLLHHSSPVDINVMSNPTNLHCEVNALTRKQELERNGIQVVDYIGISKLSCYLCEIILNNTPHRGTHGLVYWYGASEKAILENEELCIRLVEDLEYSIQNPALRPFFQAVQINNVGDFIDAQPETFKRLKGIIKELKDLHIKEKLDQLDKPVGSLTLESLLKTIGGVVELESAIHSASLKSFFRSAEISSVYMLKNSHPELMESLRKLNGTIDQFADLSLDHHIESSILCLEEPKTSLLGLKEEFGLLGSDFE